MLCRKKINQSKDESLRPLGTSLPETNWGFKTGLDSSGGSRGAENTRCMSEAGATGLRWVQGKEESEQRRFQGSGLRRWVESDVI